MFRTPAKVPHGNSRAPPFPDRPCLLARYDSVPGSVRVVALVVRQHCRMRSSGLICCLPPGWMRGCAAASCDKGIMAELDFRASKGKLARTRRRPLVVRTTYRALFLNSIAAAGFSSARLRSQSHGIGPVLAVAPNRKASGAALSTHA